MNARLNYYHVFVKVYEHMSMSVAADELFLSQPAVSRIIRELETEYETRFFLRQSGRLYRTEAGDLFYIHVRQMLDAAEQLDHAMRKQKTRMKVHIGATPTVGCYYLPDALARYQWECGGLEVFLHVLHPAALEEMLRNAQLDFAVAEGMRPNQEIAVQPLMESDMVFIAADPEGVPDPIPLLIRNVSPSIQQELEQRLYEAGIRYQVQGEFSDIEGIKRCAAKGLGVGLVPAGSWTASDGVKQLDMPQLDLKIQISIVRHRKKFVFPQLKQLISLLEEEIKRSVHGS